MVVNKLMSVSLLICGVFLSISVSHGSETLNAEVTSGVKYDWIGRWDQAKLNTILKTEAPTFSGVTVDYTPATNTVQLYRVTYSSVVPERSNKPILATGLLAIPEAVSSKNLPLVSYQHGTVYDKYQVPSFPEESPETALMIAQFAGQGYIVIGADYFGMGESAEPEGYMVKASHQQASYDVGSEPGNIEPYAGYIATIVSGRLVARRLRHNGFS